MERRPVGDCKVDGVCLLYRSPGANGTQKTRMDQSVVSNWVIEPAFQPLVAFLVTPVFDRAT